MLVIAAGESGRFVVENVVGFQLNEAFRKDSLPIDRYAVHTLWKDTDDIAPEPLSSFIVGNEMHDALVR